MTRASRAVIDGQLSWWKRARFHNSRLIVRCAREVRAGGEVLNCYGPHRAREPARHRRAQLRAQYFFTCNCTACVDTERKDFVLMFNAYACQSCKGPVLGATCAQCRAPLRRDHARALLERADDLDAHAARAVSLETRCELAHAALRIRQQAWHRHHVALRDAADNVARLYADLGEFSKSVELIKQNIQSLEYQFGSFSVEVAHELRKLSDVMLERIINSPQNPDYRDWCLEAHKVIKKAVQLMELNYGSWEPLVKRLKQQEALVASQLDMSRTPDSDSVHHSLHYNLKI
ncbi:SET and MYND domain-containing protein 4-like [Hyposmocoma kahamanoa]|uniref:SET and MYND domain-containing protein 4-like n=1 Tax=Hyposmocoma kahamanoa TaxID=1477025 RepID=UPI000E6D9581|nr:SET and MYND domain-containing protein 4-like [Hyposmocoma kahamanoa]